jgi:hypothetical protein
MDPWLEHPSLWPDVHNSLITAIRDSLAPQVAPKYYVALERRSYRLTTDDLVFVGRPDVAVVTRDVPAAPVRPEATCTVLDVVVPVADEVEELFLEVRDVETGSLVTLLELLSPGNKLHPQGRADYLQKREEVLRTRTSFVEVDLLRGGQPMPVEGASRHGDYRILVARGAQRPRAKLSVFTVRDPIPTFALPLLPGDDEPDLDLGQVLHALYDRARFDLRLDYRRDAVPALPDAERAWANARIEDWLGG